MGREEGKGLLSKIFKGLFEKSPEEEAAEFTEEIAELVDEGEEKGLISPEEGEMIVNIVHFRNVAVREVMIPRKDIVAVEIKMPFAQLIDLVSKHPHTRYPVYERDLDHILGILHVKDLLCFCRDHPKNLNLRAILRQAYVIPETKKVRELLKEFRRRREQIAVVIDEMGVVTGLVTLQDILQDIIGEEGTEFERDREGWYLAEGTTRIDELERFLGLTLPRGNYETIGGFILSELGKIPAPGERFSFKDIEIEILAANERFIEKIRFRYLS